MTGIEITILEWIDFPDARYEQIAGDHDLSEDIRVLATPGHTRGHQSLIVDARDGPMIIAGQACYSVGEWTRDPDALEGWSSAPDQAAYEGSIERVRALDPDRVLFGHDRHPWTADHASPATPAILSEPC